MFKQTKARMLNATAAHPRIIAAGIGVALSVALALALSVVDNGGFAIHQAFAGSKSGGGGGS